MKGFLVKPDNSAVEFEWNSNGDVCRAIAPGHGEFVWTSPDRIADLYVTYSVSNPGEVGVGAFNALATDVLSNWHSADPPVKLYGPVAFTGFPRKNLSCRVALYIRETAHRVYALCPSSPEALELVKDRYSGPPQKSEAASLVPAVTVPVDFVVEKTSADSWVVRFGDRIVDTVQLSAELGFDDCGNEPFAVAAVRRAFRLGGEPMCPDDWVRRGEAQRRTRRVRGETLVDLSRATGRTIAECSGMERGEVEPLFKFPDAGEGSEDPGPPPVREKFSGHPREWPQSERDEYLFQKWDGVLKRLADS